MLTEFWLEIYSLWRLAGILPRHLNIAAFINTPIQVWQLTSGQATKVFSVQLGTPVLFTSEVLFIFPLLYIYVISFLISMCHDHLVNWHVNLSFFSCFCKPVSSLSTNLLTIKSSVLLTKKIYFSHANLPTMQQFEKILVDWISCLLSSPSWPMQ